MFMVLCLLALPKMSFAQQAQPCCTQCQCLTCGDVASCQNLVNPDPELCPMGGTSVCGSNHPTKLCESFTENYYAAGQDEGCVPIDGGLGFLIAGGVFMGIVGTRRRKSLDLLSC